MNSNLAFKLFDIRGKYPEVVDERLAYALAKALCNWRKLNKVLVGCDTRESSPSLKEFLTDGFSNTNVQVYDLGEAPIPMFNFAMTRGDYDLGIMVTASHISQEENGFKIIAPGPLPLDQQEISEIKQIIRQFENEPIVVPKLDSKKITVASDYVENVLKLAGDQKPRLKLSVDVGKSAVVTTMMIIFQKIHAEVNLADSPHGGNPLLPENRRGLEKEVIETSSDLGVIWDSDGDRVVFIDRRGKLIPMSFVLGILAADAVSNDNRKKVAVDVRAGLVVRDLVTQAGGTIEVFPAWNPNLKFAMHQDPEFIFGGETSGHFIFADFHLIDDGILAALRFIRLFDQGVIEPSLDELAKKYFELPEQNIPCSQEKSVKILDNLTETYRDGNYYVSIQDGLTVFGSDWKFNLRQSATESYLRLNLEARSEIIAKKIYTEIKDHIDSLK